MLTKEQIKKIDTVYDYLNEIKSNTTNQALVDSINAIAKELSSVVREIEFAPSTEREVWIDNIGTVYEVTYGNCEVRSSMDCVMYNRMCRRQCPAFTVKNGCAICKMMRGNQIIGRIVEKPQE